MMGYDTLLFDEPDDWRMIVTALREGRIVVTRDTQIMKRGAITSGRLKAVLITTDEPEMQMRYLMQHLNLGRELKPFTICLECNESLIAKSKQEVADRVPPYVFKTQSEFVECPACHRIYWKGTHWQAMVEKLRDFRKGLTTP